MSPRNFFDQLLIILQSMTWGSGEKIFGKNVYLAPVFPGHLIQQIVSPSCFIIVGEVKYHEEHPFILFQRFQLFFFVENVISEFGQGGLTGSNRVIGTSRGVGMFDLEGEVLAQLKKLTFAGQNIFLVEEGASKCQYAAGNIPLIYRGFSFSVLLNGV